MSAKILIVGLGNMGRSHALSYHALDGFEIVGLCSRSAPDLTDLPDDIAHYPRFRDYETALTDTRPDAVCIATWPDTHAAYAKMAFTAGAHVFLEKPLAETVEEAEQVVATAQATGRKLVVGYILRHHPSWAKFVAMSHELGKPLVMRMNLNQQSHGSTWDTHKRLMNSLSPMVDCGVHYVDVMCQMTRSKPVSVHAIGARLSDEIAEDMMNYGQLQVRFEDGSVGWYEAGWGPMMSETAFFVKDVIGPKGSISIVASDDGGVGSASDDVDAHTKTSRLRLHHAGLDAAGRFTKPDELLDMSTEPGHQDLCDSEQRYFLDAIQHDLDLTDHMQDAVNSLRIVLAADQSIKTGQVVAL